MSEPTTTVRRDVHRIGGASVENLRLKPREAALAPPGISVLVCDSPQEAADQMRTTFPRAVDLHAAARVVGSSSAELIRAAGFDIMEAPSKPLPNHHRIIHPDGAAGFTDENLARLATAFDETTGH